MNLHVSRLLPVLVMFVSIVTSGCANTPIDVDDLSVRAPSDLSLPIEASVRVDLTDQQRSKIHTVSRGALSYPLAEGGLMLSAATKMFRRGFSNVASGSDHEAHLVVRAKSLVRTSWDTGIHFARVIVRIEQPDGTAIGDFVGSGSEISKDVANTIALENAFIEAFMAVLSELMADERFLTLARSGYFNRAL